MPLTAYNVAGAVQKLDLSEELAEIIRTDNFAFLQRVGAGGFTTNQIKHSWPNSSFSQYKFSYLLGTPKAFITE